MSKEELNQFTVKLIIVVLFALLVAVIAQQTFFKQPPSNQNNSQDKNVDLNNDSSPSFDINKGVSKKLNEVELGDKVKVDYSLTLPTGQTVDSTLASGKPFIFTVGSNEVIPGFNKAVLGMKLNEQKNVTILPGEGYGELSPEFTEVFNKNVLIATGLDANELLAGIFIQITDSKGKQKTGKILKIGGDIVEVDFHPNNSHPFYDKELDFWIKVLEIQKRS